MKKRIDIIILLVLVGIISTIILFPKRNKIIKAIKNNSEYTFGIDVSHYQGHIEWEKVKESYHPIEFVFVRSTMGVDGKDKRFHYNWKNVKKHGFKRGAYHYFRPNEDATKQFENFKNSVQLDINDFPPVLDIEEMSKKGISDLQNKVKKWLILVEEHYGVKPIVYTGRKFYNHFLKETIIDYPLWIASYSDKEKIKNIDWDIHQFSEKIKVDGIKGYVDGNDLK